VRVCVCVCGGGVAFRVGYRGIFFTGPGSISPLSGSAFNYAVKYIFTNYLGKFFYNIYVRFSLQIGYRDAF
jgi:hypothetical protein